MSKTDPNLRGKLQQAPTYQLALRGGWFAPGMPHTPGFRAENLRAAARADGIDIPSGYQFDKESESFTDANADHWYSDPRVLGPIAVGASTLGTGMFGAPASVAPASASTAAGVLPSTSIPVTAVGAPGAASTIAAGVPGAVSGGTGAGMGWGSVLSALKNPKNLAGIGRMFTSGAQASASNRGAEIEAALAQEQTRAQAERDYNNAVLAREQEGRQQRGDAWKQLQQTSYIQNWKPMGANVSPYTRPLAAPGAATVAGAAALQPGSMERLTTNPVPAITKRQDFNIDPSLLKGSMWEKLQGYLGAGLEGYGTVRRLGGPAGGPQ